MVSYTYAYVVLPLLHQNFTVVASGCSTVGPGGGTGPQLVARPKNLAIILRHRGQLILRKISKFDAPRWMSDSKAKMHKIRFQRSPGAPVCI